VRQTPLATRVTAAAWFDGLSAYLILLLGKSGIFRPFAEKSPRDGREAAGYNARMTDVTQILFQIEEGDATATDRLLPLVYAELRQLAAARLSHEKPGQTLQPTALVHEAYLRLVDQANESRWENSRHFFGAAAEAMRRILIERARQKKTQKRGGHRQRIDLAEIEPVVLPIACEDLLGLDDALEKLQRDHPRKAELVKLRFFAGLTISQAAQTLGISSSTAENDWAYARSWLRLEMLGP
jgi:RNA polymerase sigma factor (TIGR02999 family)